MSFRTTLVLAVILIGLGIYAYFGEYKGGQKKEQQKENEKVFLEIKKDSIDEVRIEGAGGPVRLVPVSQDVWQLTSPIKTRADQSTVDRI